ncbi:hypothetical protein AG1IA_07573 [Rhizoctonia solani AG-1 IA]|uniref:Uncharacterized protein n=1 Tax=Thanatephorus cucumeris (strain AG1-IA) TaxID=983506 RepID=L8WPZ1_THACA|nr:hypothetical protein AG1IA_07573 [Rhizoctonia solani AG-1 IA]
MDLVLKRISPNSPATRDGVCLIIIFHGNRNPCRDLLGTSLAHISTNISMVMVSPILLRNHLRHSVRQSILVTITTRRGCVIGEKL